MLMDICLFSKELIIFEKHSFSKIYFINSLISVTIFAFRKCFFNVKEMCLNLIYIVTLPILLNKTLELSFLFLNKHLLI